MRKEFEMTDEQFQKVIDASKPVPYMVFNGVSPQSPQERANEAWKSLGEELGFDWLSVKPLPSKGHKFFTANNN